MKQVDWRRRSKKKNNSDSIRSCFFFCLCILLLFLTSAFFRLPPRPACWLYILLILFVTLWRCCVKSSQRTEMKRDRQNRQSFIRKSLVENQCWLMLRFNEPQWKVDLIIEPFFELSIKSHSIRALCECIR